MRLIIQGDRIVATATDAYDGPEQWMTAPESFDVARMGEYRVAEGVLVSAVPASCQRRQGRLELIDVGHLLTVENYIASIEDPILRLQARVEYEADTWERTNPLLVRMWVEVLGSTERELDEMFRRAVLR